MNFDVFTISALVDEMMDVLVGGRVQDVLDTDATGIGFEIYAHRQRRYLYLSADPQTPRVHLVPDRLRRGTERPNQLGLLLRRFVEGGILTHVSQPPWERMLTLEITGPEGEVQLIVEPMERRANLLLVQSGVILDCMRRVGPDENRVRVSLPNHPYVPPPPITNRLNPFHGELDAFINQWANNTDPKRKASQWLSTLVLGCSPLLSREVVYRATHNAGSLASEADPAAIWSSLQKVMEPLKARDWQPGVAYVEGNPVAYSVYPLTHLPNWTRQASTSEALVAYYGAAVGAEAYAEARKPVQAQINEAKARLQGKLASLESGLKDEAEREYLQRAGELILAYQYAIQPGQRELVAEYDFDAAPMRIALDPALSPLENAQRYFDRYNRAKRAQAGVPQLIEETRMEMAFLDQLTLDLEQAASYPEIDDVVAALVERGLWQGAPRVRRGSARTGPMRLTKDGYVIWIGRNSLQNELATFKYANPPDYWLHARGVPGAHGIIRYDGRAVPDALIQQVAAIAAYYSAKRSEGRVDVDVTRVKYVRKMKGAGPGMVTYRNETTITVTPMKEDGLDG
ncbi:MAG: NFACT RNA binding domain-containing protein [Aggregatilineales bacterium]